MRSIYLVLKWRILTIYEICVVQYYSCTMKTWYKLFREIFVPMFLMHHNRNEPLTYPQEQLIYKYQINSISLNTYETSLVSLLRGGVKKQPFFSYSKKLRPPLPLLWPPQFFLIRIFWIYWKKWKKLSFGQNW